MSGVCCVVVIRAPSLHRANRARARAHSGAQRLACRQATATTRSRRWCRTTFLRVELVDKKREQCLRCGRERQVDSCGWRSFCLLAASRAMNSETNGLLLASGDSCKRSSLDAPLSLQQLTCQLEELKVLGDQWRVAR